MKKAFTLIELLVVIAIIAILAAILFPVFAQAKAAAKKSADLSNMKQIGTATMLYVDSYDDTLYPHRFNCNTQGDPTLGANATCPAYLSADGTTLLPEASKLSGTAEQRYYWIYMLQPFTKNYALFKNPGGADKFVPGETTVKTCYGTGCTGTNYGGQNSYGHNDLWLSPSGTFGGGGSLPASVVTTSIPRVASTILTIDASYYGAVPDVANQSGSFDMSKTSDGTGSKELALSNGEGAQYINYWKNIGGANWSYRSDFASYSSGQALADGAKLHGGNLNAQFADGHAKSIPYKRSISDICLWTTDIEGAHPNCG